DPRFERVGDIPYGGNIDQFDECRYSGELGSGRDQIVRRAERRQRKAKGVHRPVCAARGRGSSCQRKRRSDKRRSSPGFFSATISSTIVLTTNWRIVSGRCCSLPATYQKGSSPPPKGRRQATHSLVVGWYLIRSCLQFEE